ncbi:MAG: alpha/beta hydrolase, partial [Acidimicrobiales bacterium]
GYRAPRSVGEPDRVVVGTLDRGEQEELLDASRFTRRAPASGLALAGRWLAANLDRPTGAIARRLTPDDVGVTARRAGHAARMTVEVGGEARTVRERAVRLGPLGLFGVETLPDPLSPTDPDRSEAPAGPGTRRAAERPPVVVFLSSGNDSHIGPSRLWVSLGRRWAAAGFRCVRVDLSGLGESPAREGQAEQVLRPPEAFDDVLDVAAAVAEDPKDVVLVGLCSGAYQALDSALELAPLGVLAINPVMRFVPPEVAAGGRISERRQLCIPRATWSVALRSRLPKRTGDRVAAMRAIWERWRPRGHRTDWRARFLQRGVQVYCICGEQEAGPFRRHGAGMPEASGSSAGMQVEAIAGLDHALLAAGHRELVVDRLTEALHRMTGR